MLLALRTSPYKFHGPFVTRSTQLLFRCRSHLECLPELLAGLLWLYLRAAVMSHLQWQFPLFVLVFDAILQKRVKLVDPTTSDLL